MKYIRADENHLFKTSKRLTLSKIAYMICDQDSQNLDFSNKLWGTSITRKEFQKLFETNENQNDN